MARHKTTERSGLYDFTLDLHGMFADEAMALVRSVVSRNRGTGKSLLVIHGNGSGTLRSRIRGALSRGTLPCRNYFPGEDIGAPGSDGVTVIHF
ncbi:MAG: Smr/MutS family protein [Victivallales bacterium]|jgi:mutS2 protein